MIIGTVENYRYQKYLDHVDRYLENKLDQAYTSVRVALYKSIETIRVEIEVKFKPGFYYLMRFDEKEILEDSVDELLDSKIEDMQDWLLTRYFHIYKHKDPV